MTTLAGIVWWMAGIMGAFVLGCGLLMQGRYNERKKAREQRDIDKKLETLQMVKIPPEDLALMRQRILKATAMYRTGGALEGDIEILQMPEEPKGIPTDCTGCRCYRDLTSSP